MERHSFRIVLGDSPGNSQEAFFFKSVFTKVGHSALQTVKKRGMFCKEFWGIFEILEHSFLSEHFQ